MIYYKSGGKHILLNVFRCKGTVFATTTFVAIPSGIIASLLYHFFPEGTLRFWSVEYGILRETQLWAGFSFLVGFLIVFRTSQAYGRFWEGCTASYRMRTEWFDAVSSCVSFTKMTNASAEDVLRFKELLIRLTSMLHAAALAELEAGAAENPGELWAHSYEIIDPAGVDSESIASVRECSLRTELIFTWLQQLIVENVRSGVLSIPPPILSRCFHEMANGMVAFHDAMRIAYIPFPFPYAQACDIILMFHYLLAPLITSQWVTSELWAFVFCFIQIFIMWSLNLIAIEIDHPFGRDSNDIDGDRMQSELNESLSLLVSDSAARTPQLSSRWRKSPVVVRVKGSETGDIDLIGGRPSTMGEVLASNPQWSIKSDCTTYTISKIGREGRDASGSDGHPTLSKGLSQHTIGQPHLSKGNSATSTQPHLAKGQSTHSRLSSYSSHPHLSKGHSCATISSAFGHERSCEVTGYDDGVAFPSSSSRLSEIINSHTSSDVVPAEEQLGRVFVMGPKANVPRILLNDGEILPPILEAHPRQMEAASLVCPDCNHRLRDCHANGTKSSAEHRCHACRRSPSEGDREAHYSCEKCNRYFCLQCGKDASKAVPKQDDVL